MILKYLSIFIAMYSEMWVFPFEKLKYLSTKKNSYFGTKIRNKFRMAAEKEKSGERAPLVYQRAVSWLPLKIM